jgi:HSP20 family molecular chaperone IbpA
MRFNYALPLLAIPSSISAFHVGPTINPATATSTSLEARRLMVPMIRTRRPSPPMLFPDIDRVFREMDEMMESSFADLSLPNSRLDLEKFPQARGLGLRDNLGFEVTEDDQEYKVSMKLYGIDAKDLNLLLDADGWVLRLKGNTMQEDGGMKIQSSFEKAILLHPDVDTDKISACFDGGVLTIAAPKVQKNEYLDESKIQKIDIKFVASKAADPKAATEDNNVTSVNEKPSTVPTRLAVESMKNEKVNMKKKSTSDYADGDKKWPARDFPY